MDILETLKKYQDKLLEEDLQFYQTEVLTGNYDDNYIDECLKTIQAIRQSRKKKMSEIFSGSDLSAIRIDPKSLNPNLKDEIKLTVKEQLFKKLDECTRSVDTQRTFEQIFEKYNFINEKFINENFSRFHEEAIDYILKNMLLSEGFLEKYFAELDKSLLSKYQKFSEEFFMKHFKELNVYTVLTKGINEWRKKSNRSSKLNVFLKLKGVKI